MVADVLDLRAFCLVADLGSITEAARRMRESKATVSRRITRLESAVGVSLVTRSPRRVQPTEDGAAYRERIVEVLDMLGAANDAARRATTHPTGTLRVTSGPEFNSVLAPLVVAFTEKHPTVKVEMIVSQAVVDLDRQGVDVALRVAMQLEDSALIAHKLTALDAVVVASPAYVQAHGRLRSPADLERHRIASLWPSRSRALPLRHLRSHRVEQVPFAADFAATDMNFLIEIALAGGALTFAPAIAVRRELAAGSLVRVLPDYELAGAALFLLHRAGQFVPPKVRAFREFMLDAFRKEAYSRRPKSASSARV